MDLQSLLQKLNAIENSAVEENCGSSMPVAPQTPPTMPPSMSVNLNAQGMDNIEDLLKLITKVNSSMPTAMPALDAPPRIGGTGDDMKSFITKLGPMDAPEKEGFQDATTHPDPEIKDISASIPSGDDLHKKKTMHKAAAGGDNPMATEAIVSQLQALLAEIKSK